MIWKAAFSLQLENILLLVEEEASTPRLAGNKMLFLEGLGGENSEELLQSKQWSKFPMMQEFQCVDSSQETAKFIPSY